MLYEEKYVHGEQHVQVPAHLNFGQYIFDEIKLKSAEVVLECHSTGEKLTYKALTQNAVNLSIALTKLGVGRGDVVAVGAERRTEYVPTLLAILFSGAAYTPYDINSGRAALKHKLSISQPKYFITSNLFWNKYSDILKKVECIKQYLTLDDALESVISIKSLISADVDVNRFIPATVQGQTDTAVILYSSGTTGMPKGVQLTHLNCILSSIPNEFNEKSLKTAFIFGEWFHNYDTFITYKLLLAGMKIVYINKHDTHLFLKCVEHCAVDIAFLIPSYIIFLSKVLELQNYDLNSLKILYSRSSPLHSKTIKAVKQRLPMLREVLQGYGMTEAGEPTSECWGTKGPKDGSVGMASPTLTIKVVNTETRKILGPDQQGEICLKGPVIMKGYIGVDPSTYMDEEGFFKTGDLGYYDNDKYFYIVDRLKDIIIHDGYNVPPLELEAILQLHPAVREAGVVGKPVPVYGEDPTAFVVKQPGSEVTEKQLIDYVALEVSPYMQLRGGVRFIEEIPRNSRGKVLRRQLRELLG